MGKKKGSVLYIGLDESNNGRFPTIYVATYSENMPKLNGDTLFKKERVHRDFRKKLGKISHSFLLLDYIDKDRIENYKMPGIVLASLICGENVGEFLKIYVDGELFSRQKDYVKDILNASFGLEKGLIDVHSGKDLDRKVNLVNQADEIAHYLLRRPFIKVRDSKNRKVINYSFLI